MGRERKDKWDENGHKLPELWKLIAGALGLVEKTEEHLKCAGGTCLIHEPRLEGPLIPRSSLWRRVSMCRRLKNHRRDKLTFSVLGWRRVLST